MITYAIENIVDIKEEVEPLLLAHIAEVPLSPEYVPNIDWDTYYESQEMGNYLFVTARKKNGKLVGYVGYCIFDSMTYNDVVAASQDCIYADPKMRGKGIGKGLINFAEEILTDIGVDVVDINMHTSHPFRELAEKLGYEEKQITYIKYLGDKTWD